MIGVIAAARRVFLRLGAVVQSRVRYWRPGALTPLPEVWNKPTICSYCYNDIAPHQHDCAVCRAMRGVTRGTSLHSHGSFHFECVGGFAIYWFVPRWSNSLFAENSHRLGHSTRGIASTCFSFLRALVGTWRRITTPR